MRDTSPRTSRANAFSSRSSASVPAASSSVTNISDTVTATATANESSGVLPPFTTCSLDLDRLADRLQDVVREAEVVAGDLREALHRADLRVRAESFGRSSSVAFRIASDFASPSTSKSRPKNEKLPPETISFR